MKKRIGGKRAIKILSCANGKIIRYTYLVLCLMAISGCRNKDANPEEEPQSSWAIYCEKYHVDPVNPTEKQENFYMDCYVGSVEEERDLNGIVSFSFDSQKVPDVIRGVLLQNTYYVVYTDSAMGMEHECIAIDSETANLVKTAITSTDGRLSGYMVLNKVRGVYNYNHEMK